jgi:hypothetical protein
MDTFENGEPVEIEIRRSNRDCEEGGKRAFWQEAVFLEQRGDRAWVRVRTIIGFKKQSVALEKVRRKQSCAS